jgi:putative oxidoreductase
MKQLAKILRLDFLPCGANCGLLALRLWVGLSMLLLHGWMKIANFDSMSGKFLDLMGIGSKASLVLAIFGEAVCSILLILGLFTRFAALSLVINMTVAFTMAHKGVLKGPGSGETAFIYLATYVTLFLAGPGKFSVDAKMGGKV